MGVIGRFLLGAASKFWVSIGPVLLGALIARISAWVTAWKRAQETRAKAHAEREATEAAQTPKEREDAADSNRRL
jgi:hypothetical protein